MKFAIVTLNWNTAFQVPVSDLSKFLEMLGKYPIVEKDYDPVTQAGYAYLRKVEPPHIDLVENEADQVKRTQVESVTP